MPLQPQKTFETNYCMGACFCSLAFTTKWRVSSNLPRHGHLCSEYVFCLGVGRFTNCVRYGAANGSHPVKRWRKPTTWILRRDNTRSVLTHSIQLNRRILLLILPDTRSDIARTYVSHKATSASFGRPSAHRPPRPWVPLLVHLRSRTQSTCACLF